MNPQILPGMFEVGDSCCLDSFEETAEGFVGSPEVSEQGRRPDSGFQSNFVENILVEQDLVHSLEANDHYHMSVLDSSYHMSDWHYWCDYTSADFPAHLPKNIFR